MFPPKEPWPHLGPWRVMGLGADGVPFIFRQLASVASDHCLAVDAPSDTIDIIMTVHEIADAALVLAEQGQGSLVDGGPIAEIDSDGDSLRKSRHGTQGGAIGLGLVIAAMGLAEACAEIGHVITPDG